MLLLSGHFYYVVVLERGGKQPRGTWDGGEIEDTPAFHLAVILLIALTHLGYYPEKSWPGPYFVAIVPECCMFVEASFLNSRADLLCKI